MLHAYHIDCLIQSGLDEEYCLKAGYSSNNNGFEIPYYNPLTDELWYYRKRLDEPLGNTKYLSPTGAKPHIYFTKYINNWKEIFESNNPIIITEGEKKADCAIKNGLVAVGIGGVWGYLKEGKLIPDFDLLLEHKRDFYIVFDCDSNSKVYGNTLVNKAKERLMSELEKRGFRAIDCSMPGPEKGLDDYLVSQGVDTLKNHIKHCIEQYEQNCSQNDEEEKDSGKQNQAELLLTLIKNRKDDFTFFHDENKSPFVRIRVKDHFEIWKLSSNETKHFFSGLFYKEYGKPINGESIKNVINILSAHAIFEGAMYELNNRVAWHNDAIYYDLSDKKCSSIKISESGYKLVQDTPILFRRYSHQLSQPVPVSGVDLMDYLKFFNVKNESDGILLLCWALSCFIPDIPHPALYLHGIQGSAKSTCQRMLKRLIDNSSADLLILVNHKAETAQVLSHHWLANFDNISKMDDETSDTLCRAISGYAFSKRELFSDDNDVILKIKRCIGLNGINMVAIRPDLLERSIIVQLEPIPATKRCLEKELLDQFDAEKAAFLGAAFDVVSKAMTIKKTLRLANKPRMSDFFEWSCCFVQAMRLKPEVFIEAYMHNLKTQYLESIHSDFVMKLLYEFITEEKEWKGTAEDLNSDLFKLACNKGLIEYKREWKVTANSLGRSLNRYKPAFEQLGIYIDKLHTHSERVIRIVKKSFVETVAEKED